MRNRYTTPPNPPISPLFVGVLPRHIHVSKLAGNVRHGAQIGHHWPSRHFSQEGDDVQKRTYALAGLAVAAAGGVLITGSPAYAGALVQGHRHHHHYSSHRNHNRNLNFNRNHNRVLVRVNVRNRNVNTAWAGGGFNRGFRDFDRDSDFGLFRHRCRFGCGRFGFDDDFGRDRDRDDDDRGDNIIVGNDFGARR
ncbi:hypothetical protein OG417_47360 [Actinoallomurus sp. NBC_01490]|uniref:hypothetical protein n=1 Tax=Actinoallomurus sp. NBC_01490 TaxID=2903557 RepID=UPI002E2F2A75|nr:hypothetical protein [Actinoallomurus sp. NBC_01490]